MMTFTNEQMFNHMIVLSGLNEKGMLGYAIARNRRKLEAESKEFSEKRDELLKEFGTEVEQGRYQLVGENLSKFAEALKPYSELTAEVNVMQVSQEEFCSGNLTSSQMYALDWMVKD